MRTRSARTIDTATLFVLLLAMALLAVNILRILYVPLTHDEGITYNWYISALWGDIINIHPTTANDHILNSLLSKAFMGMFGNSQFCLRLTNLLAQVAYMYFSFRILKCLLQDKLLIAAGFLLLNLNPFLFEFWGLCRGYGLSIALMTGSIYYMLRYIQSSSQRLLWYSLLMAMLAVYANYALLYFFVSLPLVVLYTTWLKHNPRKIVLNELLAIGIASVLLFLTIVGNLKALTDEGQLYYGGDIGLVHDTISSLVRESLYLAAGTDSIVAVLAYILVAVAILTGVYFITSAIRKKDLESGIGLSLYLLLLAPLLVALAQHYIAGSKLVIERTALFFVPLFILQFVYALARLPKVFSRSTLILLSLAALINFCAHMNFSITRSWPDDAPVLLILQKMDKEGKTGPGKIKVRSSWRVQPALQFYIATKYRDRFAWVLYNQDPVTNDTSFDYYYIHRDELELVPHVYKIDTVVNRDRFILLRKIHS